VLSRTGAVADIPADIAEAEDSRHSRLLLEGLHNQVLAVGHRSHRCREVEASGRHREGTAVEADNCCTAAEEDSGVGCDNPGPGNRTCLATATRRLVLITRFCGKVPSIYLPTKRALRLR